MTNEDQVREIGGQRLVCYYDRIMEQQRKRWNVPDWRTQPWIAADFQNARDVAAALEAIYGTRSW